jgi:hypothetical protein
MPWGNRIIASCQAVVKLLFRHGRAVLYRPVKTAATAMTPASANSLRQLDGQAGRLPALDRLAVNECDEAFECGVKSVRIALSSISAAHRHRQDY